MAAEASTYIYIYIYIRTGVTLASCHQNSIVKELSVWCRMMLMLFKSGSRTATRRLALRQTAFIQPTECTVTFTHPTRTFRLHRWQGKQLLLTSLRHGVWRIPARGCGWWRRLSGGLEAENISRRTAHGQHNVVWRLPQYFKGLLKQRSEVELVLALSHRVLALH
jgi:hypothetical protein